MDTRRFVPLLAVALLAVFTTCDQAPTSSVPQDDLSVLAKPDGGQGGGKLKTVSAVELGLEYVSSASIFVPANTQVIAKAMCPDGKVAIAGGFDRSPFLDLRESKPADIGTDGLAASWSVTVQNTNQGGGASLFVLAVCING